MGENGQRYKGMKEQWNRSVLICQGCSHLPRMFSLTKNQSQSREDAGGQQESVRESLPAVHRESKAGSGEVWLQI